MKRKKSKTKRSTRAEFERRVDAVLKLRLGGAEFQDLREYAVAPEQAWNVSDTQLWRYVAAADRRCEKYFDTRAGHLLSRHLLQRRALYAYAMAAGDYRTALAVLQDEARLEGLYPPTRVAPTNPDGDEEYGQLTDEERAAGIAAILARFSTGGPGPTAAEGEAQGDGSLLDGSGAAAG
jgi:hypothetical protein